MRLVRACLVALIGLMLTTTAGSQTVLDTLFGAEEEFLLVDPQWFDDQQLLADHRRHFLRRHEAAGNAG